MNYIGNLPNFDIIQNSRFDYIEPNNPAYNLNPPQQNMNFLNSETGEIFHCIDSTKDTNIWVGNLGTEIP